MLDKKKIGVCCYGNKVQNKRRMKKSNTMACFKHNLKLIFVAICGKHAKFLSYIYIEALSGILKLLLLKKYVNVKNHSENPNSCKRYSKGDSYC